MVGMGKAWYDASEDAKRVFLEADRVAAPDLGGPLSDLCFSGEVERLNRTDVSQPAIFATSVACWRGLLAEWGGGDCEEAGVAACAGLSLGEYTALHIAGAVSFEEALRLVILRGRAMQEAADDSEGGMVALIGADDEKAGEICESARGDGVLVCANYNAPGQVVLSGDAAACERAVGLAEKAGVRASRLPVAGAFHSPLMAPAAERLAEALEWTTVRDPLCDVYCNVTAEPHGGDGSASIEEVVRRRLVEQLTSPVQWARTCRGIAERWPDAGYHELAPGKTLAGLFRRVERRVRVQSHDNGPETGSE